MGENVKEGFKITVEEAWQYAPIIHFLHFSNWLKIRTLDRKIREECHLVNCPFLVGRSTGLHYDFYCAMPSCVIKKSRAK